MMTRLPDDWGQMAYRRFLEAEGIPLVTGLAVDDLHAVEVAPWPRLDARGAYIQLTGAEDTDSGHILEIPPGRSTAPDRHLYEEVFLALAGRGTCEVWNQAGAHQTFEWQRGSVFAIPLNTSHRLHNGSGREPARLLGVTTAPLMINLLRNLDFIFRCPFDFTDRFQGQADYFTGEGTLYTRPDTTQKIWETNFVADVYRLGLYDWVERGAGGKHVKFELANNALIAHVSEFPVGTYKKAHRHGPGAHVVILEGEGFSLMWTDQHETFEDIRWKPGAMFVPPGMWWHQHFNTGRTPARYLAIRWGSTRWKITRYLDYQGVDKSAKAGGNQIEYADQDPRVHQLFVERCRANGVEVRMDQFFAPAAR
ncbi:MAG: cupin domain-containing protein [Armatimonadota bacterium]|nr:cupin domain-containing protein [Armatimonadota bacterium]MDR7534468.1 cupin domain-containing protein [Armatimonadota bacterium]MDR7535734.1 cupin domain-containing protein [Armatimonadota bacterium]